MSRVQCNARPRHAKVSVRQSLPIAAKEIFCWPVAAAKTSRSNEAAEAAEVAVEAFDRVNGREALEPPRDARRSMRSVSSTYSTATPAPSIPVSLFALKSVSSLSNRRARCKQNLASQIISPVGPRRRLSLAPTPGCCHGARRVCQGWSLFSGPLHDRARRHAGSIGPEGRRPAREQARSAGCDRATARSPQCHGQAASAS